MSEPLSFFDEEGKRVFVSLRNPLPATGGGGGSGIGSAEWANLVARVEALEDEFFPDGSPVPRLPKGGSGAGVPASITVDPAHVAYTPGAWEPNTNKRVNWTIEPPEADQTLAVTSSDDEVCTAEVTGTQITIKAWTPGDAVVTATTINGLTAEITVHVPEEQGG